MDRFTVISADCHAVGRPEHFTPYLEAKYLDAYAESQKVAAEDKEGRAKASEDGGQLFSRETLDEYHGRGDRKRRWHHRSVGSERRVKEPEDDGVVAESCSRTAARSSPDAGARRTRELRRPGCGVNRWLADFASRRGRR
jgi:hypothetical protein